MGKLRVPPLRFAPGRDDKGEKALREREAAPIQQLLSPEAPPFPLSSRPKRTRISYFALLATSACAALRRESRMLILKAAGLDRKSGGA
jgi:hypothetical protein